MSETYEDFMAGAKAWSPTRPGDLCDDTCTVDCGHCKGSAFEREARRARNDIRAARQRRELAQTIANHAQALADGKVISEHAAVRLLQSNIATLAAWTPDDRR